MGRQIVMLRGESTGQVGTIGTGGLGHWQLLFRQIRLRSNCLWGRVRTGRRRLEASALPLCRSNYDPAEIQTLAGACGQSTFRFAPVYQCPSTQWHHGFCGRQARTHHRRTVKIGEFMELVVRSLVAFSAVISLLFLFSSPFAFAGGQHGLSIKVFTSPDDQFWNNSVIIDGTHEAMFADVLLSTLTLERVLHEN